MSLDRAREITTSIGTFRVHRIAPELYGGMAGATESRAGVATPEKALFDTVYLLIARTGHGSLPEIEVPDDFDVEALCSWVDRITSPRWRTLTVAPSRHSAWPSGLRAKHPADVCDVPAPAGTGLTRWAPLRRDDVARARNGQELWIGPTR